MFSKNLKYYRLKNRMTKKELAEKVNVSAMAITNYENGTRRPSMDILNSLAEVLDIRVSDFLKVRNENLVFSHGEFRKTSSLSAGQQEYIRESVEEYFSRFMTAVEVLGGNVLPEAPENHSIPLSDDAEENAEMLKKHLGLAANGPVEDLIGILENKGILIYECNPDNSSFSGMNGLINDRPYIVLNSEMTPERNRSTAVHELAHLMFVWPEEMEEKEAERMATAIGGAFLFPESDAVRELGVHRSAITNDMLAVAKEYGISMMLLVKRAELCGIITPSAAKSFYIKASRAGWKTAEPSRINREEPTLFHQLVYRAVNENEISIQRGAELLNTSYESVKEMSSSIEVEPCL
ncbi:MAG: ImmA/IrrE family metallo-endopeptidase [Solobacterium sp.]|nr:helix-turn-helix domain-containing protein [Erysipelotrichaceae bacterium]MBQ9152184.1 ImmA/IrrE family metallo-endopeptidase [Solobacterium sp.]